MVNTIFSRLRAYADDYSGAVTVDWVVLTALIVGLNIALLIGYLKEGFIFTGDAVNEKIEEATNQ